MSAELLREAVMVSALAASACILAAVLIMLACAPTPTAVRVVKALFGLWAVGWVCCIVVLAYLDGAP